jgi:hypothetical protein
MQVTVTLSNGTGTQNIDGLAIVQAIPSGSGSLLQVDQYNGSAVELLVDESPATIATDTGNLLFSVTLVPVPLVVTASFNYDGATTAFLKGERVFIGNAYGEIIALTGSSMTLGNFVGNQLNDNDFIRGQQSLCTAQINGAVTYTYPQQQSTYINVGRCQGLKPAVTDLSSLNYIYASPKVEILYTTLTESQLNAASAAAGGGGGYWTQSGGNLYPTTLSDNVGIGTNSPTKKLEVSGTFKQSVTQSGVIYGIEVDNSVGNINITATDAVDASINSYQRQNYDSIEESIVAPLIGAITERSSNSSGLDNTFLIIDENGDGLFQRRTDIKLQIQRKPDNAELFYIDVATTNVGIGTATPTEKLDVVGNLALSGTIKGTTLPAYDDDADAASLAAGDFYQTTGLGAAPLNAAGIVMVKQ